MSHGDVLHKHELCLMNTFRRKLSLIISFAQHSKSNYVCSTLLIKMIN